MLATTFSLSKHTCLEKKRLRLFVVKHDSNLAAAPTERPGHGLGAAPRPVPARVKMLILRFRLLLTAAAE